jgi:hypothetical protein
MAKAKATSKAQCPDKEGLRCAGCRGGNPCLAGE